MKTLKYIVVFGILGGLLGSFIGTGETTWIKKSQRNDATPIFMFLGLAVGVIAGLVIGLNISEDENKIKEFGFDTFETTKSKVGRKWVYQTKYINPKTGNNNFILTSYSNENDTVITFFNHKPVLNHNTNSGSDKNMLNNHNQGLAHIKQQITSGEIESI